jgi:uncharacterized membrane protein YhaH (DUF805 family)
MCILSRINEELGSQKYPSKGTVMSWYLKVLKQYADFEGRARRKEYWMFILFNILFSILAAVLDNVLGIAHPVTGYGPLYIIYVLVVFVPGIAVTARRLHDIGKSGWMLLLAFIPCVGGIILIVFFATDGNPGDNQYGANPK